MPLNKETKPNQVCLYQFTHVRPCCCLFNLGAVLVLLWLGFCGYLLFTSSFLVPDCFYSFSLCVSISIYLSLPFFLSLFFFFFFSVIIFQASNKRNLTRKNLNMAEKGKPDERKLISCNRSTKQRYKN